MTRLLPILLLCLCASAQTANVGTLTVPGTAAIQTAVIGGGSSPVTFSDDFNRADNDSLGANWTEAEGDTDIASNKAAQQTAAGACTVICNTSLNTTTTYVRANDGVGQQYPQLVVRYTDASSPYYAVEFDFNQGQVNWLRYASVGASPTTVGQTATGQFTAGTPTTWAITITGTGDSTVVRVWQDPANNTPAAVDGWDTGGDTADWTFTDNPASPVNTGSKVGFGGYQNSANTLLWDDFYTGDI